MLENFRLPFAAVVLTALSAALIACAPSEASTAGCTSKQDSFVYLGENDLILQIDQVSTGATFYLGSKDQKVYLAKDLSRAGIVHWGWFAITEELVDGGRFDQANVTCQGYQISADIALVRCQSEAKDRPIAYVFEHGRGIVRLWWNDNRESLATLNGACGYGSEVG